MRIGRRYLAMAILVLTGSAAAVALKHFNSIPAFVILGPGYVVQAWLFEHHRALGGFGYQMTMIGVSAAVWTLIILGLGMAVALLAKVTLK